MKRTSSTRRMSRVLFGLATAALVMSACASDSSPSSDETTNDTVSSDTSAPRQRNTMVGGFGTDGSGFVDIPLVGSSWSRKDQVTLSRNADGSSNIAFIERGIKEGVPFNTLVQARLLATGIFDATFGKDGFVKIEISDESVIKILFDSKGNPLLWAQTYVEIPNSGATPEEKNWKEVNKIYAYTFGASTPNTNYGSTGVIALDEVAPEGIVELVVGSRGTVADGFIFSRYFNDRYETVSLTSAGEVDTNAANGGVNTVPDGQHEQWDSHPIDTSIVAGSDDAKVAGLAGAYREGEGTDCAPEEYCPGPVVGFDYNLVNAAQPLVRGTTTDVDDLLDGGMAEVVEVFAASGGTSSKNASSGNMVSAQSAEMKNEPMPVELIVKARNYKANSVVRGVLNSGKKSWESVTHFSFYKDEDLDMRISGPEVAPTGPAVVAYYYNYNNGTNGLIACNSQLGVCDVKDSAVMVYSKDLGNWPNLSSVHFDTDGKIHALVRGLTVSGNETDAVVDIASDGLPASAQIEMIPASLLKGNAAGVVSWTASDWSTRLGGNNTIYVGGTLEAETPGQGSVPAIATLTKTQNSRLVKQERNSRPNLPGAVIDQYSRLWFDSVGNEYAYAWKDGNPGVVRLLAGSKAIDKTYGVGGYARIGLARENKCAQVYFEVAASGQAMGAHVEYDYDPVLGDCLDDTRRVASVVALTSGGVAEDIDQSNSSLATQNFFNNERFLLSPATKDLYIVDDRWVVNENKDDKHLITIRRYDLAGKLDTSFGTAGVLSYDENSPLSSLNVVAIDNQGQLILGNVDETDAINLRVARLKRDGTLDAGVDVPPPPAPTPSEQRTMREEQQQVATNPVPQPAQQPSSVLISGTKAMGDGSIEVSWISNAVTTNATFTVTASPGGKTCTSTTTSCVVKGLNAWEKYTFTVSQAGETAQSSASAETQPVRMVKVGSRVSVKKLLTPGSKGAVKYAVSGGCKLSKSTTLIAPKKAGTCLLSVKTAKVGKTAAVTRSVRIQIVTALPK